VTRVPARRLALPAMVKLKIIRLPLGKALIMVMRLIVVLFQVVERTALTQLMEILPLVMR